MKEIRAYIRRDEVNPVVETLRDAGAPGVSIIEIHPLGYGYEASGFVPHKASVVDRYRHLAIVKLEIVCMTAPRPDDGCFSSGLGPRSLLASRGGNSGRPGGGRPARRHPLDLMTTVNELQFIPCFCGCVRFGHKSNRDCYIKAFHQDGTLTFTSHAAT